MENQKHFLVSADAVPPVFSKVLKAKELLATNQAKDVTEAVKLVGISRSVYYKYYRRVQGFSSVTYGRKASLNIHMKNEKGILSKTLFQGLAIHSVAIVQLMLDISEATADLSVILKELEKMDNIIDVELQNVE